MTQGAESDAERASERPTLRVGSELFHADLVLGVVAGGDLGGVREPPAGAGWVGDGGREGAREERLVANLRNNWTPGRSGRFC